MRDVRELLVYNDIGANLGGLFLSCPIIIYLLLSDRALTLNDSIRGAHILIIFIIFSFKYETKNGWSRIKDIVIYILNYLT